MVPYAFTRVLGIISGFCLNENFTEDEGTSFLLLQFLIRFVGHRVIQILDQGE